ncbi:unnamed protein product, partial [Phaeothamnion confervicola]
PEFRIGTVNLTGNGAALRVSQKRVLSPPPPAYVVATATPLPPVVSEVQTFTCQELGSTAGAFFTLSFRGETTAFIAAGAVAAPFMLPPCSWRRGVPCRGDGSSVQEKLQALSTV